MKHEIDLPALTTEQSLSFGVNDILGSKEFKYDSTLNLELRKEHFLIGGEQSIHVFQTRVSADDGRIKNIVQFMSPNSINGQLNNTASWYTGDDEFDIFTFKYPGDVETILKQAKAATGRSSR